ncbi:hypothetical protein [Aliiruegeria lutimaris]|uniref:Flagellar FliJ protein n=1 Tax=Aliiruegeria lutimaris TaxID=571298 RepID=A0A1G8M5G9_9RHOB|nr:hypothetical protein [Aliiruegeria lutimaris]SDI63161.1 hypothetical protein SAMN04488026_100527 [Aliiruegeria lutimaris]
MKNRLRDLKRLKSVTEAAWLAASQSLREKAGEERAATARLNKLARDRETALKQIAPGDALDVAQVLSTTRWLRWVDGERARQNMTVARLRAELAREQEAARRTFAKDNALSKLLVQADAERKRR